GEAVFSIISLFLRDYAPIRERAEAATERMLAIPELLRQGSANLKRAPRAWVEKGINECTGAIALLTEGVDILFERHGVNDPAFFSAARVAREGFRIFKHDLQERLLATAHDHYACGAEAFDMLLRTGHCLEMDGAAVEAYARARLEEARRNLAAMAEQIEPGTPAEQLLARLQDDHPAQPDYYPAFQAEFDAARTYAIERELLTWPDYPIVFEPIPDWARAAQPYLYFLFYRAPAPFDPHVVQRYLMTPVEPDMPAEEQMRRLRATNRSQIRLNHIIHHGGIGHHVQNWWAYRAESRIARVAAVDCALRIAMLCGGTMAEGWACYAVDLMGEQGYFTPLEALSEQQSLARMAARAVVDCGLHRGTLSFDAAVAFYRDEASMPEQAARTEVIKNSMFPGAAMMYLIGTDAIHTLRRDLQDRWGAEFSLRRFHDAFLAHGSLPVALVAKLMQGEPITLDGYVPPLSG
ncbi:MAG: hypothetical protein DCC58_18845, partial [Chloroflexi bacterium]